MQGAVIDVSGIFLNKLRLTEHAKAQVLKRGIELPTIRATVCKGAMNRREGAVKFCLMGFVVILNGYNVITTYYQG